MIKVFSSILLILLCSCASKVQLVGPNTSPHRSHFTSSDGKRLPLRHWNYQTNPETIILALHGIDGAARDFRNLGKQLPKKTSLYALNLRGLGYDPVLQNQGDIQHPDLWIRDLLETHQVFRQRFPDADIIWLGESMGALIALNAAAQSTEAHNAPHGLILASPVVTTEFATPTQKALLETAAALLPRYRLPLDALTDGSFQTTSKATYSKYAGKNDWHVEGYTLRFLKHLKRLAQNAPEQATAINCPTLILRGHKDLLAPISAVNSFAENFCTPPTLHSFPNSHHLLFYDKDRKEVINSIVRWLKKIEAS